MRFNNTGFAEWCNSFSCGRMKIAWRGNEVGMMRTVSASCRMVPQHCEAGLHVAEALRTLRPGFRTQRILRALASLPQTLPIHIE